MYEFFNGLGLIGWLGIVVWILFGLVMLFRSEYFLYYEYRFPKLDIWDDFLYEEWHFILFMTIRFLVILFVVYIVTKIMFLF